MNKYHIKKKGITLNIGIDEFYTTENPRDMDTLGKMVCWHRNYNLGDKHYFEDPEQFQEFVNNKTNEVYCVLDVYLYDHSGLAMSTKPFNDRFDSGQVGYIYCTVQDLKDRGISLDDKEKVEKLLKKEVIDYNNYLGDDSPYYYYQITDEDDYVVDTMTGFSNNGTEQMIKDMQQYVDTQYEYLFDELIRKERNKENCL